ncbi:MAG TPA: riboflavin synthase [Ignavibacteria bacterium]|nr:riboflavin synthase [Ignavibacteria bacterium]
MFTGIVQELGYITKKIKINEGYKFRVKCRQVAKGLGISDSVSINGVCHTIEKHSRNEFEFTSMHETLKKTNIGKLDEGSEVNLEPSLSVGDKLGGHFVFGHVDDTGIITSVKQISSGKKGVESDNWEYWIKIHKKHYKFVIYVGSISVDGVSLTVADIKKPKGNFFHVKVAIIPFTYHHTTFHSYRVNTRVNLEFDFLGKYVINAVKIK